MRQPHYFSVLGRPGRQVLVMSVSLTHIVIVTGEGIENKAQPLSLRWEFVWAGAAASSGWARVVV